MPRVKPPSNLLAAAVKGPLAEVLTLAEVAAYLRLPEPDVQRLIDEQNLPGRRLGNEWRFLKSAIQEWLSTPIAKGPAQGIWAAAGALQDDPYLDDLLREIDRLRGRSMNVKDFRQVPGLQVENWAD